VSPQPQALDGAALMREFVKHSPFAQKVGLRLERIDPDTAEVVLPFAEANVTMGDVVHGGAISTLVDVAAVAAAWSNHEIGENPNGATVALSVNYLGAARGSDLHAVGRVTRRGRRLCFCAVEVRDAGDEPIAQGLATYRFST
jgi:uncharacterized protein (TIGR00369 family)